jgi:hypothetical protein
MRYLSLAFLALISLFSSLPVLAINYGSGTYGTCTYDYCSISLTSTGTVDISVTPTSGGSCSIASDKVTVDTYDSNGFTLTLNNSYSSNSLNNAADNTQSIPAISSASLAFPAPLTANAWGYRVDGSGGFGSTTTIPVSNVSPTSTTFAPTPSLGGTPDQIRTTTVVAHPAVDTLVWYGVCANTNNLKSGSYTSGVIYTAVTNG